MGSCLLFRSQLNHTAESLIGSEGVDTYFHQIVAGISFLVSAQIRLLIRHQVDFFHLIPLTRIQSLKFHRKQFLSIARMNVISIKHSLVLIRCGVHHGHVVAVIRRDQSVLVAVQNHFLQTCPVGNCILAVSQFVRIQLFQSDRKSVV